jgi:hypothetical protein
LLINPVSHTFVNAGSFAGVFAFDNFEFRAFGNDRAEILPYRSDRAFLGVFEQIKQSDEQEQVVQVASVALLFRE